MSLSPPFKRFAWVYMAFAGALPLWSGQLLYRVGLLSAKQVGWFRTLGLWGVFGLGLALVALVLTLLALRLGLDRASEPRKRLLYRVFFTGAALNVAAVGLSIYYWSPRLAPPAIQLGTLAALGVFLLAYWRYGLAEQRFVGRALMGLGLVALATPLVASPWLVQAALRHNVRIAESVAIPAQPARKAGAPRRVVLVSFDALRAGSTSMHRPELGTTPHLAGLARESHWFTQARSACDGTQVSLTSLLSGVEPAAYVPQLDNESGFIPYGALHGVSGYLKAAGYKTYASTMFLSPAILGLAPEFDRTAFHARAFFSDEFHTSDFIPLKEAVSWMFQQVRHDPGPQLEGFQQAALPAIRRTFQDGLTMLGSEEEAPSFLWVHIGAPHLPYYDIDPQPLEAPLDPRRYTQILPADLERAGPQDAARLLNIYHRYVRFVDNELNHFMTAIKARGWWDDTLFIVVADHGEQFTAGCFGHGGCMASDATTHVPLVIHQPGQRQGQRHDQLVGHIDVLPTILGEVYQQPPTGFIGRSVFAAPAPGRVLKTYGLFHFDQGRFRPKTIAAYRDGYHYAAHFDPPQERLTRLTTRSELSLDATVQAPEQAAALRKVVQTERARFH